MGNYSKEEISRRNKEYREKNRDKLIAYDKSPQRKAFHKTWLLKKRQEDPCRFIFYSAKHRAKKDNILFTITKEDVYSLYPSDGKCPILGIELSPNTKTTQDSSPSLDRIVPEKGYVIGNIVVVSHRANRIKNNATLEDLKKIVCFLEKREA
jgi:hypothetical protein